VDAALGLDDGGIEVIAEEGLVPVPDALRGILLGGGLYRYLQAAVVLAGQYLHSEVASDGESIAREVATSLPNGACLTSRWLLNAKGDGSEPSPFLLLAKRAR
jgi:hypothetical protein